MASHELQELNPKVYNLTEDQNSLYYVAPDNYPDLGFPSGLYFNTQAEFNKFNNSLNNKYDIYNSIPVIVNLKKGYGYGNLSKHRARKYTIEGGRDAQGKIIKKNEIVLIRHPDPDMHFTKSKTKKSNSKTKKSNSKTKKSNSKTKKSNSKTKKSKNNK
jgi:hypothetical protein